MPDQKNLAFAYPLLVRERHLDTFGHMNNAVYLEIFEEARWEMIARNGYGMHTIKTTGHGPTILEINLRFIREITLREEIVVKTQMLSYERKIGKLRQWMENSASQICCEALFTIGLFDIRARKLIMPTPEWLKAIGVA